MSTNTAGAAASVTALEIAGQCLCGGIRFQLVGPLRPVIVCHCRQCARWSGHLVAATSVPTERFILAIGQDKLGWFQSSPEAERGFCRDCGSSLFWRPADRSRISVMAGCLDQPCGLPVSAHIYCDDAGDYEARMDAAPRFPAGNRSAQKPPLAADKG